MPAASGSSSQLRGRSHQRLVLLLRLWTWRRCDSLCRDLSRGEIPPGSGAAPPMAWPRTTYAGRCELLSPAARTALRGSCLSRSTRNPLTGSHRSHANRLRARRVPAPLVDGTGPPFGGPVSGWLGHIRRLRHVRAPHRFSTARQPLWAQHLGVGAASPVPAWK